MIGDCEEEEIDIYEQLAEKDNYLILAAEAGKVLLEKNQELTTHFESLQEEYLQKIEGLEQDRHYLKKELNERGVNYESRMQELQSEIQSLGGQLAMVQKSSRTIEHSTQSTYQNLTGQNTSLLHELDKVKSYNGELTRQVELLTNRIDEQAVTDKIHANNRLHQEDMCDEKEEVVNGVAANSVTYSEVQSLKEAVKQLSEQKNFLEESLSEIVNEKYAVNNSGQQQETDKVSTLVEDVSNLRSQMMMCQEELGIARRKNEHLKDQLEEYVLMQSSQPGTHHNTSLLNELELSIPEVDMNFRCMSTPMKYGEEDGEHSVNNRHILNGDENHMTIHYEKLRGDLQDVYHKLKRLKNKLTNEIDDEIELHNIDGDVVTKLVDEIIDLIHQKTVDLMENQQTGSLSQVEMDNCDIVSQQDSQGSDTDLLEQHVHDLNRRLNHTRSELEKVKRDLVTAQITANESKDAVQVLTVKTNFQEREIENLRKEREILLKDQTMEEKLKKALQDRDEALKRENAIKANYEVAQGDMSKLNDQLIAAVRQKLELSEQLEEWQYDMASLIDKQLDTKIKRDNQQSRKRSSSTASNPARSFAAKLFSNKSNKGSRT